MIVYDGARFHPTFLFTRAGSVMPWSCMVALPCAFLAVALKLLPRTNFFGDEWGLIGIDGGPEQVANAAFSGLSFLIGFLVVFRASQAYDRFWEGCSAINTMQGEWFDAGSSLLAFTKLSSCPEKEVVAFQNLLVRLLSMLVGAVLMELSVGVDRGQDTEMSSTRAFELELIGAGGLDIESLATINRTGPKVELIFQWIQQLVVEAANKKTFSVEPPILSRSFQELANGMVQYRIASKIARIPFPFPYVQATEMLLVSHWILTPALMCMWTASPVWTGILTFVQVMFFWSLNSIATELENPFGEDVNDLPAAELQQDFNERMLLLIDVNTIRTAQLSAQALHEETTYGGKPDASGCYSKSKPSLSRRNSLGGEMTTFAHLSRSVTARLSHISPTEAAVEVVRRPDKFHTLASNSSSYAIKVKAELAMMTSEKSDATSTVSSPRTKPRRTSKGLPAASKDVQDTKSTKKTNEQKNVQTDEKDTSECLRGVPCTPLDKAVELLERLPSLIAVLEDLRAQVGPVGIAQHLQSIAESCVNIHNAVMQWSPHPFAGGAQPFGKSLDSALHKAVVERSGRRHPDGCINFDSCSTRTERASEFAKTLGSQS